MRCGPRTRGPRGRPEASVGSDRAWPASLWTSHSVLILVYFILWASCERSDVGFRGSYLSLCEFKGIM